jgi:hypothetical protein
MHAVVVRVKVIDGPTATQGLREQVVPRASSASGFVSGNWVRLEGSDEGTGMVLFESQDAAQEFADHLPTPPGDAVSVQSVQVGEVVASA